MENVEVEKSKVLVIVDIIEYISNSILIQTIIKKSTGNISASSFDSGQELTVNSSRFDTFIQIIDGKAQIVIDDITSVLKVGQSIIIPAHSRNTLKANERFKMISTIIKSGYEEWS